MVAARSVFGCLGVVLNNSVDGMAGFLFTLGGDGRPFDKQMEYLDACESTDIERACWIGDRGWRPDRGFIDGDGERTNRHQLGDP